MCRKWSFRSVWLVLLGFSMKPRLPSSAAPAASAAIKNPKRTNQTERTDHFRHIVRILVDVEVSLASDLVSGTV